MSQRNHYKKLEVIFDIIELATIYIDHLHIFVNFQGHVNQFSMYVLSADAAYHGANNERLMDAAVYLEKKDALKKLSALKEQLIKLIAQTKSDRQEVA